MDKIFKKKVSSLLLEYIEKVYEPLWEKYSSLHFINDEIINKIPQMELPDYLSGHMSLRKLIIMKLCSNPNYENYRDWLMKLRLESFNKDPEKQEENLRLLKKLIIKGVGNK